MSKILYFPSIALPETKWTMQMLLYWDKIGTIVPLEFLDNPESHSPFMRKLIEENLVEQIIPGQHIYEASFGDCFLNFIDTNPEMKKKVLEIQAGNVQRFVRIHLEKLDYIGEELQEKGLAFKVGNWYMVEETVGKRYMSYLAVLLGTKTDFSPITENLQNMASIYSDMQKPRKPEKYLDKDEFRKKLLESILPIPSLEGDILDILRFKERHGEKLLNFRRYIESFLQNLENETDDFIIESKVSSFKERTQYDIEDITARMKETKFNFKNISMASLFIITPQAGPLVQGAFENDHVKVGSSMLSLAGAIYYALQQSSKYNHVRSPLVYSVLANQKFNKRKADSVNTTLKEMPESFAAQYNDTTHS